jgi:putative sterol carrier protein
MAAKVISPIKALASGKIKVQGSWIRYLAWNRRFELN